MKFLAIAGFAVMLAIPMVAGAQDAKTATPPPVAPVPTVPVATKLVPAELTSGLQEYQALDRLISKLQAELEALQTEQGKTGQNLIQLAAKDGFHYDQSVSGFVENPPVPAPTPTAPPAAPVATDSTNTKKK